MDLLSPKHLIIFLAVLTVIFYLLPYWVARSRRVASRGPLLLVNILLGFTVIGWLVCLIWAVVGETELQRELQQRQLDQLNARSQGSGEPRL